MIIFNTRNTRNMAFKRPSPSPPIGSAFSDRNRGTSHRVKSTGGALGLIAGYGAGNPHEIVSGWVPKFVDHT